MTTLNHMISLVAWDIAKLKVQIIDTNMNAQIGKEENNKFCLHN